MNSTQLIEQLANDWAHLVSAVEDILFMSMLDATDRRDGCSGTASAGFLEALEFIYQNMILDHLKTKTLTS
ncbi:hypothetical protein AN456_25955 [Pseudomonas aeruginosa]|nr:hypothetical protein AN455_25580 [Pseudomonas aeruginosa]KRU97011.1 hypothetical protein AN456_25955 [Pseudomonas aeruginosa]